MKLFRDRTLATHTIWIIHLHDIFIHQLLNQDLYVRVIIHSLDV